MVRCILQVVRRDRKAAYIPRRAPTNCLRLWLLPDQTAAGTFSFSSHSDNRYFPLHNRYVVIVSTKKLSIHPSLQVDSAENTVFRHLPELQQLQKSFCSARSAKREIVEITKSPTGSKAVRSLWRMQRRVAWLNIMLVLSGPDEDVAQGKY